MGPAWLALLPLLSAYTLPLPSGQCDPCQTTCAIESGTARLLLQGWVDLIDVLVAELGNQVDARDNYQFTPLHSGAPPRAPREAW